MGRRVNFSLARCRSPRRAIYLSRDPRKSLRYGEDLILCRVLPGLKQKSEDRGDYDRGLYDSLECESRNEFTIRSPDQGGNSIGGKNQKTLSKSIKFSFHKVNLFCKLDFYDHFCDVFKSVLNCAPDPSVLCHQIVQEVAHYEFRTGVDKSGRSSFKRKEARLPH